MTTAELYRTVTLLKSEYSKVREITDKNIYHTGKKWESTFEKAAKLCWVLNISPADFISEAHKQLTPFANKLGMSCFAPNMMSSEKFISHLIKKSLKNKTTTRTARIEEETRNQVITDICSSEHVFSNCLVSFLRRTLDTSKKVLTKEDASDVRKAVIIHLMNELSQYWLITDWQVCDMYCDDYFTGEIKKKVENGFKLLDIQSWRSLLSEARTSAVSLCDGSMSHANIVEWSKKYLSAEKPEELLPNTVMPDMNTKVNMKKLEENMIDAAPQLKDENLSLKDRVNMLKGVIDDKQ